MSLTVLTGNAAAEKVTVQPGTLVGETTLQLGLTHDQYSADDWSSPPAVARAGGLLHQGKWFQNQHLMGWGALNPEPAPDHYDWSSLDQRVSLIRKTGGIPVITLCCAPDWMKGGAPGTTDWSRIEVAPAPAHYGDFADLARQVARRYPDVRHYQVWNELKGFYDPVRNRWDYERYTDLYNAVYDALKSVDPRLEVGGPYVPVDTWSDPNTMSNPSPLRGPWGTVDQRALDVIDYWLDHKRGADFITLDQSLGTKDRGLISDEFTAVQQFSAVAGWIHQRTGLPLWWAEFSLPKEASRWDPQHQAAVMAAALAEMSRAHVDVALLWEPQGTGSACGGCLWTDTRSPGGGKPTPSFSSVSALAGAFPPGSSLVDMQVSSHHVIALASTQQILFVNRSSESLTVIGEGFQVPLGPYGTKLVRRPRSVGHSSGRSN